MSYKNHESQNTVLLLPRHWSKAYFHSCSVQVSLQILSHRTQNQFLDTKSPNPCSIPQRIGNQSLACKTTSFLQYKNKETVQNNSLRFFKLLDHYTAKMTVNEDSYSKSYVIVGLFLYVKHVTPTCGYKSRSACV